MVERQNNTTGLLEVHISGLVTEIRDKVLMLNNEKQTPYRLGNCEIKYPDGGIENVLTRFYSKSIIAHPETFKVGAKISIVIQTEGDYAGRAVAHLPGTTVDVSRLLGKQAVETEMIQPIAQSIVTDNVVKAELVI